MPRTRWGVSYSLVESKWTVSNSEIVLYFASEPYLNKFLERYEENRQVVRKRFEKITKDIRYNTDALADILLYKSIETRGFFVRLRGAKITWDDLEKYALRKMTEPNTLNWQRTSRQKLTGQTKSTE